MAQAVEAKPLKGVQLTCTLCKVVRSIRVSHISKHYDQHYMELYFQKPKRSGGEKGTSVEMLGNGEALVHFKDRRGTYINCAVMYTTNTLW